MRSYNVATTALTLGVHPKWLDNLLSHHSVPGVSQSRQGVQRKLTPKAILIIEITKQLIDTLGATAELALKLAIAMGESGRAELGDGELSLQADLSSLEQSLNDRLAESVELAPIPKRGRPYK